MCPPIGPSSELTHAGRPYELTLLVSTVLVTIASCEIFHIGKDVQKTNVIPVRIVMQLASSHFLDALVLPLRMLWRIINCRLIVVIVVVVVTWHQSPQIQLGIREEKTITSMMN